MAEFNAGKTQGYDVLQAKSDIRNHWLNCSNDWMKQELGKTGNYCSNEIMWEWFVGVSPKLYNI